MMGDIPGLKPCPFCGGEAEREYFAEEFVVNCPKCCFEVSTFNDGPDDPSIDGMAHWNTRAAPEVKLITFQEAISIVEDTEVAEMTEDGDRRWTRRMAEAIMQAANARILSALSQDTKETK